VPGLAYVGSLPLPLLCPQLQACIGWPSIQLDATLTGNLALNASLTVSPPTAAFYIGLEVDAIAELTASVSPISLPTVHFDLSVSVALEASWSLSLSLLADFSLGLSLALFLSAHVAVYAFSYEGPANALGAALAASLGSTYPDGSPSSAACSGVLLGAASPVAQTCLPAWLDGISWEPGLAQATLASLSAGTSLTAKAETQALATLTAKAAAQAAVSASLCAHGSVAWPTPQVTLQVLGRALANMRAQATLKPPAVSAAISATASIAASIQASAGFMAQLGACMRWDGGMFAYSYSGAGSALGPTVETALASTWGDGHTSTAGDCAAVVLAATDSFSASVLAALFGGVL
jgi:hypothetical protein